MEKSAVLLDTDFNCFFSQFESVIVPHDEFEVFLDKEARTEFNSEISDEVDFVTRVFVSFSII